MSSAPTPDAPFVIDPLHDKVDLYESPLVKDVYESKYRFLGEMNWKETCKRVCDAVYAKELDPRYGQEMYEAMAKYLWMPGGRILAGAGTGRRVTLLNCYVNARLEDSMEHIADGLKTIMLTGQQGGGIGTDFSTLRPSGAILRRTGSIASGPLPFMDTWNSACATVESAGSRRGAMMATMIDSHPDLLKFVTAKHEKGRLTNFNVSVLVTDAFISAVAEDDDWFLHFNVPPAKERDQLLVNCDWEDEETDEMHYVYSIHKARDLWDEILRSTYEYAEPGVIFIDRVNELNNLQYREHIMCTNPCAEQPLPPHASCNLGAVNLARLVHEPFTSDARFDYELLNRLVRMGTRFLDNVIDVTEYPIPEQKLEMERTRRIGLGISGLADAIHQLGFRYGSVKSFQIAEEIMRVIAYAAYDESSNLAKEKGAFVEFDSIRYFDGFAGTLPQPLQAKIRKQGIRNGVLLTIAPTGTTSIAYGNISSGIEPVFLHEMKRNVTQPDRTMKAYTEFSYGARLYGVTEMAPNNPFLPRYMNTFNDVQIHEHIRMQEVCQRWVDASISKTINLPKETTFEEFRGVYSLAYDSGLKGCTTYRPSDVRGSILSAVDGAGSDKEESKRDGVREALLSSAKTRDEILTGRTVKIKWPGLNSALYLTVNYLEDGTPWEVFFNSKDQRAMEWTTVCSLLMSLVMRSGFKVEDLAEEFKQIHALEGGWAEGHYYPSLIAYIGVKINQLVPTTHAVTVVDEAKIERQMFEAEDRAKELPTKPEQCPSCKEYAYASMGGCKTCQSCGYSKCS